MGGDQEVEQGSRPDKRVYELTPARRAALQRWVDDPLPAVRGGGPTSASSGS